MDTVTQQRTQVGMIAGTGLLPLYIAEEAIQKGYRVVAIAFPGFTNPSLERLVNEIHWLKLGQLQKAISILKTSGVARVVMAGKIEKSNLLKPWKIMPDRRALKLIRSLEDWRDDTVLSALANELAQDGIVVDEITTWASNLMAPLGVLTRKYPTSEQIRDIEFGRTMAQGIGALDIGQTVLVRNLAVIVVEAIEGTDKAIRRAGDLKLPDCVVVKMAKPCQDMRFDVPGVGADTIQSMIAARASVLAVEAGKTMISNLDEMISKANNAGICVVGIRAKGPIFDF